ncbi:MAG TPA: hypothetical protein VGX37_01555 [Allosphingosinicella sp.]|jgi:hypothetical protein|nr:hypothetical protein [Allosphingosinicella sp.]
MSSIPNSAMPHASTQSDDQTGQFDSEDQGSSSGAFSQIADKAREYPKTAIAAGAAVAAGVAAAAVLTRGRGKSEGRKSGGSKKSKND